MQVNVSLLTPPGRGAIATLTVEGPGAAGVVGELIRLAGARALEDVPVERPVLARFGPAPGEPIVVCRHSDRAVELHCHGGRAAPDRILAALAERGVEAVAWQEWAAAQHRDPIVSAARIALADAPTERTAMVLLDQWAGALGRAGDGVGQALDRGDLPAARALLEALLARAPLGLHLTKPWRVVLAGPANAGKSSLTNALLGYTRAIVHPAPGTTRDVVTSATAIEGWPVELSDTAGQRPTAHAVEQAGIDRARRQMEAADLVVLVFDLSQPWTAADAALCRAWPAALVVHNKRDLVTDTAAGPVSSACGPPATNRQCRNDSRPLLHVYTSAKCGQGVDGLSHEIAERLVPDPPRAGTPVPFTVGQIDRLQAALEAVLRGDVSEAARRMRDDG
jgi:tRNA modification GTPase